MALKKLLIILGLVSFIFILTIFGFYSYNFSYLGISSNQEVWAQFGDFIGGTLNPILAFLAFIALLYTIKLQSDELKDTRIELEKSAKAQQEQSKSLELQNEATKQQIFENTFFKLFEILIETHSSISIKLERSQKYSQLLNKRVNYIKINGKDIKIFSFLLDKEEELKSSFAISKYLNILQDILNYYSKKDYDTFNEFFESNTRVYFSQIYQILKFISDSEKECKITNGKRYSNILRAQFSTDELELLYFHCLGSIGKEKFIFLVEEYEFFEHLILNKNIENFLTEYDIKAFGGNPTLLDKYNEMN